MAQANRYDNSPYEGSINLTSDVRDVRITKRNNTQKETKQWRDSKNNAKSFNHKIRNINNTNKDVEYRQVGDNYRDEYLYGATLGADTYSDAINWRSTPVKKVAPDTVFFFDDQNFVEPTKGPMNLNPISRAARTLADYDLEKYEQTDAMKNKLIAKPFDQNGKKLAEFGIYFGGGLFVSLLNTGLHETMLTSNNVSTGFFNLNPSITTGFRLALNFSNETFFEVFGGYRLLMPYSIANFISPSAPAVPMKSQTFDSGNLAEGNFVIGVNRRGRFGKNGKSYVSLLFGVDVGYRDLMPYYSNFFKLSSDSSTSSNTSPSTQWDSVLSLISGLSRNTTVGGMFGARLNLIHTQRHRTTIDFAIAVGPAWYNTTNYLIPSHTIQTLLSGYLSGIVRIEEYVCINDNIWFFIGIRNRFNWMFIYNQTLPNSTGKEFTDPAHTINNILDIYTGFMLTF